MTAAPLFEALREAVPDDVIAELAITVGQVEDELRRQSGSQVRLVECVASSTLDSGGKRLRPALTWLSARATGLEPDLGRVAKLGACVELIHMATLVHDDVIDQAATRRGRPSAASVHGNTAAILSGDVMLAKAMRILAHDGDLRIIRAVSDAVVELAEGEVRELEVRGDFDLSEEEHRRVLRMKTAAFIECGCRIGAMSTNAGPSKEEALAMYGHHLGLAFQIADDVLDYEGDSATTGKPRATDFREGQATLPLMYLREALSAGEADFARRKFGNGVTDEDLQTLRAWMDDRGALTRARAAAQDHADLAAEALAVLPESPYRDLMTLVARFVVVRTS